MHASSISLSTHFDRWKYARWSSFSFPNSYRNTSNHAVWNIDSKKKTINNGNNYSNGSTLNLNHSDDLIIGHSIGMRMGINQDAIYPYLASTSGRPDVVVLWLITSNPAAIEATGIQIVLPQHGDPSGGKRVRPRTHAFRRRHNSTARRFGLGLEQA